MSPSLRNINRPHPTEPDFSIPQSYDTNMTTLKTLAAVLEKRSVKRRNRAVVQCLIQWATLPLGVRGVN